MTEASGTLLGSVTPSQGRSADGDRSVLARQCIFLLAVLYAATAFASLHVGAAEISIRDAISYWLNSGEGQSKVGSRDWIILFDIRLPRLMLGTLIGAALAVSGAVLQSLFRNPLADPGIIGISAGASLGAVSIIVLGGTGLSFVTVMFGVFSLPIVSFLGALAVVLLLQRISTTSGKTSIVTMLLAGIALQAFAMAITGILIFLADDQQLRDLTFWGLGSLAGATWPKVFSAGPIIVLSFIALPFLASGLNAISLGEAAAFHLGVPVQKLKNIAIAATAAATGAAVAVSGGIGFVGIVVPHLLRLIMGPDNRYLLPASGILGACLLIFADMISRTIVAPAELPIGIITALVGAPFFLWLLMRKRGVFDI
ncbi:MAG: iron ABC transporter permease [Pseudomonadota bacterium]